MARDSALAVGFLGLGLGVMVGAALAGGATQRRTASSERIRERLALAGIKLLTAELGQTPTNSVWVLTLELPDQRVLTLNAPLLPGTNAHSDETCAEVAKRVTEWAEHSLV